MNTQFFMIIQMNNATCKVKNIYHLNQFVLDKDWISIFQSYNSTICIIDYFNKVITFWNNYNYSKTTSKHLKMFWNEYLSNVFDKSKDSEKIIKDWVFNTPYSEYKVVLNYDL